MNSTRPSLRSGAKAALAPALAMALGIFSLPAYAEPGATDIASDTRHSFSHDDDLGRVWINDLGTFLDVDRDRDGWFSRFSVSIDADVADQHDDYGYSDGEARVFAVLSLSDSSGRERLLFESGRFDLYGRNSSDRYRIELDLLNTFPEDSYDLLVELRDARSEQLLDVVDANDFRSAENLPLEDARRDGRIANDAGGDTFVAAEYSGAAGLPGVVALLLALGWRTRCIRRRRTVCRHRTAA